MRGTTGATAGGGVGNAELAQYPNFIYRNVSRRGRIARPEREPASFRPTKNQGQKRLFTALDSGPTPHGGFAIP